MAEGWVKTHRQLAYHPMWLAEKFTRGQAWMDLIMLANHRPGHIRVRGIKIPIQRGQVAHSEATLAARWQWSRGKVRRFMDELETDKMCTIKRDNKISVINIEKYDQYQDSEQTDGTANGTANSTTNGHQTDTNKNVKNDKNIKSTDNSSSEPSGHEGAGKPEQPKSTPRGEQPDGRPNQCQPELWARFLKISKGFHLDKATQLGATAPFTDAKVLEGAKALDNLTRIKGRPLDEVLAVLGWSMEDSFWSPNLRSISALLKKSGSNGETKYANVLTAMQRDLDRRAERSMAANG